MRKIWKFNFEIEFLIDIQMPKGAEILCLQEQDGRPTMWAKVDPDAPKESRQFVAKWTGENLTGIERRYIGTFQQSTTGLVWHIFETF